VHNEKLHGMYSSPNIFLVINLKRVRWGRGQTLTEVWWRNLRDRDNLENVGGGWEDLITVHLQVLLSERGLG